MAPHSLGFVLVETDCGKALSAVDSIRDIDGVSTAYAVTGEHDIICMVEADDLDGLASKVVEKVQAVDGVRRTETALAVHAH